VTYRRWDDLVTGQDHPHVLIAEVDPDEVLPPSAPTPLGALRDLVGGLRPVGDYAVRAGSDREILIAFEKADDAARIGLLVGATSAPEPMAKATFKYDSKSAKTATAKA
jgi:hypothetical protein